MLCLPLNLRPMNLIPCVFLIAADPAGLTRLCNKHVQQICPISIEYDTDQLIFSLNKIAAFRTFKPFPRQT